MKNIRIVGPNYAHGMCKDGMSCPYKYRYLDTAREMTFSISPEEVQKYAKSVNLDESFAFARSPTVCQYVKDEKPRDLYLQILDNDMYVHSFKSGDITINVLVKIGTIMLQLN